MCSEYYYYLLTYRLKRQVVSLNLSHSVAKHKFWQRKWAFFITEQNKPAFVPVAKSVDSCFNLPLLLCCYLENHEVYLLEDVFLALFFLLAGLTDDNKT